MTLIASAPANLRHERTYNSFYRVHDVPPGEAEKARRSYRWRRKNGLPATIARFWIPVDARWAQQFPTAMRQCNQRLNGRAVDEVTP